MKKVLHWLDENLEEFLLVMDTTPAILILTPILLPIIEAIGMDPIQFGVNF